MRLRSTLLPTNSFLLLPEPAFPPLLKVADSFSLTEATSFGLPFFEADFFLLRDFEPLSSFGDRHRCAKIMSEPKGKPLWTPPSLLGKRIKNRLCPMP